MIIGICGFQGSGKDTVADYLCAAHGFVRLSFAGVLKDVCAALFGWNREMLEGRTKEARVAREQADPWWSEKLGIEGFSPRLALQLVGTDVFRRHFHTDIWVLALEKKLSSFPKVVITDCRFPNEIATLRRAGAIIYSVNRGAAPAWVADYVERGVVPVGVHESEYLWLGIRMDHTIENGGSLEDLYARVEAVIQGII